MILRTKNLITIFTWIIFYRKKIIKSTNNKIIIGYFSAEFHNHAVMHFAIDVFKNHNKSEFKIYGFSIGPTKDEWTEKVKSDILTNLLMYHICLILR